MGTLWEVSGTEGSLTEILEVKSNIITPTQLTGDTDNYNPTGLSTCNVILQDISQSIELSGLVAPAAGVNKVIWICSITLSNFNLKFMHNSGSSTAANRFYLKDNGNKDLKEGGKKVVQVPTGDF